MRTDQRGLITRIEVNPSFGTALVLAALNHRPSYRWATTDIGTSATARAFWSAQHLPKNMQLGDPVYCSHMRQVQGIA
jgi:hypothetical protein